MFSKKACGASNASVGYITHIRASRFEGSLLTSGSSDTNADIGFLVRLKCSLHDDALVLSCNEHSVLRVVLSEDGQRVLLGLRKKNPRKGTWICYGGKVEEGESVAKAVERELFEEAKISITNTRSLGEITFIEAGKKYKHIMHLFVTHSFKGDIVDTDEMQPQWFQINNLPYSDMSVTDKYWMPYAIRGEEVDGVFTMDQDYNIRAFNLEFS